MARRRHCAAPLNAPPVAARRVKAIGDTIGTLNATTLFQRILMYSDATGAATGYCGSTCLHGSDIYTTPGCSTSCTNTCASGHHQVQIRAEDAHSAVLVCPNN